MTDSAYIPKSLVRIQAGGIDFQIIFAWFDFWVGLYIDPKSHAFYICPLPCCVFYFGKRQEHP